MIKIKKREMDQYGTERFGRFIFATIRKSVGLKGLTKTFSNTSRTLASECLGFFSCTRRHGPVSIRWLLLQSCNLYRHCASDSLSVYVAAASK